MTDVEQAQVVADHHMRVDLVSVTPKKVLIVVANPSTSTTLGWPVGSGEPSSPIPTTS
jgi:hypothetical protein